MYIHQPYSLVITFFALHLISILRYVISCGENCIKDIYLLLISHPVYMVTVTSTSNTRILISMGGVSIGGNSSLLAKKYWCDCSPSSQQLHLYLNLHLYLHRVVPHCHSADKLLVALTYVLYMDGYGSSVPSLVTGISGRLGIASFPRYIVKGSLGIYLNCLCYSQLIRPVWVYPGHTERGCLRKSNQRHM